MELESDYSRKRSSGSGTQVAYTVEARYNFDRPIQIGKQIFDNRWQEVHFDKCEVGVPACAPYDKHILEHGLLGYAAAQALRWWLHAVAEANGGALCLESRIVEQRISYSHSVETIAVHALIGGEDRSNCIPDWGKKP